MAQIRLTNTKTRKKEDFRPIDPSNVRLYLCGPTVYDRAHLGNARPVLVFDVLARLLRHVYGADHVTYVRNFTDVDDKINAEAQRRKGLGSPLSLVELITERTDETIGWYHADMDALGADRPDHEPRATGYIAQMIAMIETLIANGNAYAAEGHVLFDVRSYPDYGRLSGRSVDDMIAGARVEVAPFKRDAMDFVLWKPSDEELPGWDSPWGRGRPGWHIECSAMSEELLGDHFDIHGGGIDLQFPHHENELAQSCCANPHAGFANVWLHNEMLQVEGKKMSKSLGNFFTVRDLLEKGVPGEVIRFVMLSTHYRKPMDWTEAKREEAEATLRKWRGLVAGVELAATPAPAVIAALADDLNTAGAIAALHDLAGQGDAAGLLASARMLGLLTDDLGGWVSDTPKMINISSLVQQLNERLGSVHAPAQELIDRLETITRPYTELNNRLKGLGADSYLPILDSVTSINEHIKAAIGPALGQIQELGPELFELADEDMEFDYGVFRAAHEVELVRLVQQRVEAKKAKNFSEADAIRATAAEAGFEIYDDKHGSHWRPIKEVKADQ